MAHLDNHSSIINGKQNDISGSSCGGQWQSEGSGKSMQRNHTSDPSRNICQGGENVCIFRVPDHIRICNDKAYAPSIVSLGPYGKGSTCTMGKHKHEAVLRTAARINKNEKFLIDEINKSQEKIKEYYEDEINWDDETLRMMTHDACFILEFFKCAAKERDQSDQGRSIFVFQNRHYKNSMHSTISVDIMKLENQVPLFILMEILKLEFQDEAVTELAAILSKSRTFKGFPFYPSLSDVDVNSEQEDKAIKENLEKHIKNGACHLLDLYRMVIKDLLTVTPQESNNASRHGYAQLQGSPDDTSSISKAESFNDKRYTPCAEKLMKAGIEFQPGKIRFEKSTFGISTLFLPQITLKYRTETLLRNLMAYEECQRCSWNPKPTVISNYVHLLDKLIDSEKDFSVLRDSKVIRSFVGSDEVGASIINKLAIGITVENPDGDIALTINHFVSNHESIHEYEEVMKEARDHYYSKWNVWIGQFREEHCSNPLYAISFLAGTALLVMTLIQTVYAVK